MLLSELRHLSHSLHLSSILWVTFGIQIYIFQLKIQLKFISIEIVIESSENFVFLFSFQYKMNTVCPNRNNYCFVCGLFSNNSNRHKRNITEGTRWFPQSFQNGIIVG